jgi:quinohemoprotein ethanol dehydrogenase
MPALFRLCLVVFLSLSATALFALTQADIKKSTKAISTEVVNAIESAENTGANWLVYGYSNREQRHSPLKEITTNNVKDLGLEWYFETDYMRGLEATPIVVDGVMFVVGNWNVIYALNAKTGELIWKYDPQVPKEWGKMACCDAVSRGVAVWEGKVFNGTLDGRLVAIDAATGKLVWEKLTLEHYLDKNYPYTITGAPRVVNDKVIIGNGGAEYGVRGYVTAYDTDTGKQLWRFYTVPGNPELGFENQQMEDAAKTWTGEWWKFGGGGTVWDSIVYDQELNQLLIGVGNGSPWDRLVRSPEGGDNLYLSSIVSLNPDTGEYLWHYQEVPAENWDYTATQHIMLADMDVKGETKKVIWHAPKNGFFFVIDRENGKLLSAEPYANINWASHYDLTTGRPVENAIAKYQDRSGDDLIRPSSIGAHNWQPMAHNPDTGLVYIPAMESAFQYKKLESYKHDFGQWNTGVHDPEPVGMPQAMSQSVLRKVTTGHLLAWDPKTQKEKWRVQHTQVWNGGVLSTAGNLIFQGTGDGEFRAYNATTGETLWEFIAQTGIVAPPITYSVDGEQYITVLVGRGGAFSLVGGIEVGPSPNRSRVLTFKLGAERVLPPLAAELDYPELPAMPNVSEEVLALGMNKYHKYCAGCHGYNVVSNGAIPDLKYIHKVFHDQFKPIVLEGNFKGLGMVGFKDVLTEAEADAIQAYIISRAYEDKAERDESPWWRNLKKWFYDRVAELIGWLIE